MNRRRLKEAQVKRAGFTLIEVCVVIIILIILAAILLPVFTPHHGYSARRASCASNLKQIGLSIVEYTQDNDGRFPRIINGVVNSGGHTPSWRLGVLPYLKSTAVWKCPSNPISSNASPYDWMPQSYDVADTGPIQFNQSVNSNDVPDSSTTSMVFEENGNSPQAQQIGVPWDNDGVEPGWSNILFAGHSAVSNYLFVDGHVKGKHPLSTIADGINMWHLNNHDPVTPGALKKLQAAEANFQ